MEQEEQVNKETCKKRLSPETTVLLTIGTCALCAVLCGLVHFIISGLK